MPSTVLDFEFDDTKYSQISGNFGAFGPCPGRISSHSVVFFAFPLLFSSSSSSFFFFFFSALLLKNALTPGGGLIFLLLSLFCSRPRLLDEEAPNHGGDVIVVVILVALRRRACPLYLRAEKVVVRESTKALGKNEANSRQNVKRYS
jgi:hypothetical protein